MVCARCRRPYIHPAAVVIYRPRATPTTFTLRHTTNRTYSAAIRGTSPHTTPHQSLHLMPHQSLHHTPRHTVHHTLQHTPPHHPRPAHHVATTRPAPVPTPCPDSSHPMSPNARRIPISSACGGCFYPVICYNKPVKSGMRHTSAPHISLKGTGCAYGFQANQMF